MSNFVLGALLIVGAGTFYFLGKTPGIAAAAAFLGILLVGTSSTLGSIATRAMSAVSHLAGSATAWAFGAAVPAALSLVLLILFIHDLSPRNRAKKRTMWVGVALALLITASATNITALNNLGTSVPATVTQVRAGH